MDIAKKLYDRAQQKGKVSERVNYLKLTDPIEFEGQKFNKPNGPHRIKILSAKEGTGKNAFSGKDEPKLQMAVEEDGRQKEWEIAIVGKDGNISYLVEKLQDVEMGEDIIVEAKKTNKGTTFIDVRKVAGAKTPTIQLDEDGISEDPLPPLDDPADISPADIPF